MGIGNIAQALTPQNTYSVDTTNFLNALASAQATQNSNIGNQGALAAALLAQSKGVGPNPAQQQFLQNANLVSQQQAGAIASEKGINPALAARQIQQQGAAASQQAAATAGTQGAQQQLNSEQGAASLYGNIGQEAQGQAVTATSGISSGNQLNAGSAAQNAAANQGLVGGLFNSAGSVLKGLAKGGTVGYDDGGTAESPPATASTGAFGSGAASSSIAKQIMAAAGIPIYQSGVTPLAIDFQKKKAAPPPGQQAGGFQDNVGAAPVDPVNPSMATMTAYKGGKIPAHLDHVAQVYHPDFHAARSSMLKAKGGGVPGKAKVMGDSPKNDTVKTMLSPGEVVIPRSVMESKDPVKGAADFVAEQLRKHGKGDAKSSKAEFQAALKSAIGNRRGK